jgi:hypothetical protein
MVSINFIGGLNGFDFGRKQQDFYALRSSLIKLCSKSYIIFPKGGRK